jgi:hypothetical protein
MEGEGVQTALIRVNKEVPMRSESQRMFKRHFRRLISC